MSELEAQVVNVMIQNVLTVQIIPTVRHVLLVDRPPILLVPIHHAIVKMLSVDLLLTYYAQRAIPDVICVPLILTRTETVTAVQTLIRLRFTQSNSLLHGKSVRLRDHLGSQTLQDSAP